MRFKIGICGSGILDPKITTDIGQDIIYKLCQKPLLIEEIPPDILESFQKVGILRIVNNVCYLNFTCFLKKDIELLNLKSEQFGIDLGSKIIKKIGKDVKLDLLYKEVDIQKYLFFIIGCVCLDWHGLKILEDLKLSLKYEEKDKECYGNFTIFANENFPQDLKGLFWGSHYSTYDKYSFTSFGDHANFRNTIPDLIWSICNDNSKKIINDIAEDMIENYMTLMAEILITKNIGKPKMNTILEELKFIKDGTINIPIITYNDMKNINMLIESVDEVIYDWLNKYSTEIRNIFQDLTPIKFEVEFREVFIQIWHYIFAHANKYMCNEGFIFNPYSNDSDFNGFLPVIHEASCALKP